MGAGISLEHSRAAFQTTDWTMLDALQDDGHPHREEVIEILANRYWSPVYSWLRRFGYEPEKAKDVTQDFYAQVIVGRRLFELADAEKGRFRSLILTALKRFAIDSFRKSKADVCVAGLTKDALLLEDRQLGSVTGGPDEVFEKRWRKALLEHALSLVEQQYRSANQEKYWLAYEVWQLLPLVTGNQTPDRETLAQELGFPNGSHLSVAVHTVKHRLQVVLKQLTAQENTPQTSI